LSDCEELVVVTHRRWWGWNGSQKRSQLPEWWTHIWTL